MRTFSICLTIYSAFCQLTLADEPTPEAQIGQKLVAAIIANDAAAYSRCWISPDQAEALVKKLEIDIPESEIAKMKEYFTKRDKNVAESFTKIQAFIDEQKIDRESIKFVKCEANGVRDKQGMTKAGGFEVQMTAGDEEWRFKIDDGIMDDKQWYFSDKPTNLFAGSKVMSFRSGDDPLPPKRKK